MRNPFVKFISHSASYMFFLTLLALASQRFEYMLISIVLFFFPDIEVQTDPQVKTGVAYMQSLQMLANLKESWEKYERGCLPKPIELLIILWVQVDL